jgi:hypothetical protein
MGRCFFFERLPRGGPAAVVKRGQMQWRKILCDSHKDLIIASQEGFNTQTPFPTTVSEKVLRSGVNEMSAEIVTMKGCVSIGIVRLSMDAEDFTKGMEPLLPVGSLNDWRATPSGGWFDLDKVGMESSHFK